MFLRFVSLSICAVVSVMGSAMPATAQLVTNMVAQTRIPVMAPAATKIDGPTSETGISIFFYFRYSRGIARQHRTIPNVAYATYV